ncbi:MAG TPA: hypothetical protein VLF66_15570 [Thermoanaerobaculia bacterium]|nr:hypothetical protein [Thermoanaerobaculia bacterium]
MRSRAHDSELACPLAARRESGGRQKLPARGHGGEPPTDDERYGAAFRRLEERVGPEEARAARERRAAAGRYGELMELPPGTRAHAIQAGERFATFALADLLLDVSRDVCAADPEAGQELALLALAVAGRLDPARYGRCLVADLEARSWAYLGCARASLDPPAARQAFLRAAGCLDRGSGDPLEEAGLLCLCAGAGEDAACPVPGAPPRAPTRIH